MILKFVLYFVVFRHVSPCFGVFRGISPCFAAFRHVSLCFAVFWVFTRTGRKMPYLTVSKNRFKKCWILTHRRMTSKIEPILLRTGAYLCVKLGKDRY